MAAEVEPETFFGPFSFPAGAQLPTEQRNTTQTNTTKLQIRSILTHPILLNFRFQAAFTLNDQRITVWSHEPSSIVHVMFCDNPKLKDFAWQDCALMSALSQCSALRFRKIAHCGCGHFEIRDRLPSRFLCHKRTVLQVIQEVFLCNGYKATVEKTLAKDRHHRCVFEKKSA